MARCIRQSTLGQPLLVHMLLRHAATGAGVPDTLAILAELEREQCHKPELRTPRGDLADQGGRAGSGQVPIDEGDVVEALSRASQEIGAQLHLRDADVQRDERERGVEEGPQERSAFGGMDRESDPDPHRQPPRAINSHAYRSANRPGRVSGKVRIRTGAVSDKPGGVHPTQPAGTTRGRAKSRRRS